MSLIEQALRQAQADAAARRGGATVQASPLAAGDKHAPAAKHGPSSGHAPVNSRRLTIVATIAVCVLAGLVIMAHQRDAVPGHATAANSPQAEQPTDVADEHAATASPPQYATDQQPAPVAAPAIATVAASEPALPVASEGGNFVPQPEPTEEVATTSPAEASASPDQTAETPSDQPTSASADQPKLDPATAPAPEIDFTPSAHRITAIMAGPTGGTAIIDGVRVRVGDCVGPATVTAIMPDHVELQCRGQHYVIGM